MADTFGARVRTHRERQGISLEAIAQQTKIKASLLDGLERGDFSHWPSGIFRRAYVRAYAEAIGLDADAAAREFAELHPDPEVALPPAPAPQPTRVRRFLDSALTLLSRRRPAGDAEPQNAAPSAAPTPASPTSAAAKTSEPVRHAPGPVVQGPAGAPSAVATSGPPRPRPVQAPKPQFQVDLLAAARLCTEVGGVKSSGELIPLLRDAARLLGARGLIVWTWNAAAGELRPAIIHGYSEKVRARLRPVQPDADNATAEAFRLSETRAVASRDSGRSALALPLLSASGCAGVLAIELPQERAEIPAVQAVATFIAAVLALLIGASEDGDRAEAAPPRSSGPARPSAKAETHGTDSTYSESA